MQHKPIIVYVLYGAPCSGKSTEAIQLAYAKSIRTIIHTDYIREVQRMYASPQDNASLFKVTHNAWQLLGDKTPENIVKGFEMHVQAVFPAIQAIAKKLVQDGFDAIIEGVHFTGNTLEEIKAIPGIELRPLLLTLPSGEALQRHIINKQKARANCGEQKAWQDNVSTLMTIQQFLVADAKKHGIPIRNANKIRRTAHAAL